MAPDIVDLGCWRRLRALVATALAGAALGGCATAGAQSGGQPPSIVTTAAMSTTTPARPRLLSLPGARVDTDTILTATATTATATTAAAPTTARDTTRGITRSYRPPRTTLASFDGAATITASTSAAGTTSPAARATTPALSDGVFEVVPILWATDRKPTRENASGHGADYQPIAFGPERGDTLIKGIARITIPKAKRAFGTIPRPREVTLLSVNLYKEAEDPRTHFTVGEIERLSDDEFRARSRELMAGAVNFKSQCFLYVHGYRNTFEDALYRAAQMTADMDFDGVTLVYSWPSKGRLDGYLADRDSVDVSQPHFRRYLEDLNATSGCERVHIVAHSLGARLVVDTFFPASGVSAARTIARVGQIVLASPDIDAGLLKSRAAAHGETARSVTLYANGHDDALKWSRRFAGGYTRAGDLIAGEPVVVAGIDTIDLTPMSKATWVFVGANHNTYAEGRHVLRDIAMLMQRGTRPPDRRFAVFRPVESSSGTFWRYVAN